MKRSILIFILCFVRACHKQLEQPVNFLSDLYFIEYNQILNRTGVRVDTLYGISEWNPWIEVRPYTQIRVRAAQTLDENAVFSHASSHIPSCSEHFCHYNVSTRVLGIDAL